MANTALFYTSTMARVYADQGNLTKATEIYRYLLKREPNRHDYRRALSDLEKEVGTTQSVGFEDLLTEWVELLLKEKKIHALKRLHGNLTDASPL